MNSQESGEPLSDKELFYDEHIAPGLLALAEKCKDNGLSFFASVQYGPNTENSATTKVIQPDASLRTVMLNHCDITAPNIDSYMIGLARYCREQGIDTSASMYLSRSFDKG